MVKLHSLEIENLGKIEKFEVVYNKEITRFVALNGKGKTTVGLTAMWICLKGIAEQSGKGALIGKRYQFIGKHGDSANVTLTLVDSEADAKITITRKIKENGTTIKFKATNGYLIDKEWVDNLLSMAFLSSKHFTDLSPQDQAIALGINTSEHDKAIKELKSQFTSINRDIKGYGELTPVAPAKKVMVLELYDQKKEADTFNKCQETRADNIDKKEDEIFQLAKKMAELKKSLGELPKPEELINTDDIENKLRGADLANNNAELYSTYKAKKSKKEELEGKLRANKDDQDKKIGERLDYIKSCNLPLPGLSLNEEGGLMLDGRFVKQPEFSRGEIEKIVCELRLSVNSNLNMCFLDDFDLVDPINQKEIIEMLLEKDVQIIIAEVGDKPKHDNSILLRNVISE